MCLLKIFFCALLVPTFVYSFSIWKSTLKNPTKKEVFKQYQMEKNFEKQSVFQELDLDEENIIESKTKEKLKIKKEAHQKHATVHQPGNTTQLEEDWEKQDHIQMQGEEIDPNLIFMINDVDGNGVWDETEIQDLFIEEQYKVYHQEVEMRNVIEDLHRLRNHVLSEIDKNGDGLVNYAEFLQNREFSRSFLELNSF